MTIRNLDVLKKVQDRIDRAVKDTLSRTQLKVIGEEQKNKVKTRTRLGKGVSETTDRLTRLKRLKDSTKETRKRYRGRLHSQTTVSKSNLTATGQLLDSLRTRVENNSVIIFLKDRRSTELSGSASTKTNSEVANYAKKGGRNFLELSSSEVNALIRDIRKRILDKIRN
jgi:hypothetical protein